MRRILTSLGLVAALGALGACGGADNVWAPDEQVEAVRFKDDGPPTLTLFTVISNRSGAGAHSGGLMVSGSQRVLFDRRAPGTTPPICPNAMTCISASPMRR